MRVINAVDDPGLLSSIHADILIPSFHRDELEPLDTLLSGVRDGTTIVSAVMNGEEPVAAAVGDWSGDSRVLLLSYLASRRDSRAAGNGGLLMEQVGGAWQERFLPVLTLAEIAHPHAHRPHEDHGDPVARLRFYHRHGAQALDIPYFQPALRADCQRVYGVVLAVLCSAGTRCENMRETVETVPTTALRQFLEEYFDSTEGHPAGDGPARLLWSAVNRPGGVPLLPLDNPEDLPLSVPSLAGHEKGPT